MGEHERYRYVVIGTCARCGGAVGSRVLDSEKPPHHPSCATCGRVVLNWGPMINTEKP